MEFLKTTSKKQNILKELAYKYFDPDFIAQANMNPNMICVENGVIDFDRPAGDLLRPGEPTDLITVCTKNKYFPSFTPEQECIVGEINAFLAQVHVDPQVRSYFLDHLASFFFQNNNQTIHFWYGQGSNCKTKFAEFVRKIFGELSSVVPVRLFTEEQSGTVGRATPELCAMVNKRVVITQEPKHDDILCEEATKKFTGVDTLFVRPLFGQGYEATLFMNCFMCTNWLLSLEKPEDDAMRRRIRLVYFGSKFCTNPNPDPAAQEFPVDSTISEKFKRWAPVFHTMLINRAKQTMGRVVMVPPLQEKLDAYFNDEDKFTDFMRCFIVGGGSRNIVTKEEVEDFFGEWWKAHKDSDIKIPSKRELIRRVSMKFGKLIDNQGGKSHWENIRIDRPPEEE
jgi:phage/plasmid-associated DNA primase